MQLRDKGWHVEMDERGRMWVERGRSNVSICVHVCMCEWSDEKDAV